MSKLNLPQQEEYMSRIFKRIDDLQELIEKAESVEEQKAIWKRICLLLDEEDYQDRLILKQYE